MPDQASKSRNKRSTSKSGVMPMPVLEPPERHEPPMSTVAPELVDKSDTATSTGVIPIVSEGEDTSAEREDDPATRN